MKSQQKRVMLKGKYSVLFTYRKVKRSKHIRIHITSSLAVLVTASPWVTYKSMEAFVTRNLPWIEEKIRHFQDTPTISHKLSEKEYKEKKEKARAIVLAKLVKWNQHYKFQWNKVVIRNQKTRWGSYSSTGTLSFHAAIIDLPDTLQDYLIVHELCHIGAMNHSKQFWALVTETLPNAKLLEARLKKFQRKSML